jgi:FAD/FMN-containing dehydrogenase
MASGAGVGLLAACSGSSPRPRPSTSSTVAPGSSAPTSSAAGAPTAADWRALAAGLAGSLVRPGQTGFALAHELYDPRWDAVAPLAVVRAGASADVSEAVAFARAHGLALVPRGGGHSYLGASTIAGGLVVDTRALKSVAYDAASGTATIGAGAALIDVYTELAAHGRSVPAGTCPSVGVAGLALGGGFGVFDRAHGLTCDVVQELDVVLASGQGVTVDAQRQPDLFWALRGGGGGDFGVVTRLRMATFATHDVGRWYARWSWSQAAAVIAGWQRFLAAAGRDIWANLNLEVLASGERSVLVIGFALSGDPHTDLDACIRSIGITPAATSASVHDHLDTVLSLAGCTADDAACHLPPQGTLPRQSFVAGSSVIGRQLPAAGIAALLAAVADTSRWRGERHAVCDPLGGAVAAVGATSTAFPWRAAPFTVQWYANLPVSHPAADVTAARAWVGTARARTSPYAVGSYINYPSPDVTDPATYHGSAYARLRQVKAAVDPTGFLRPPSGVPG